MGSAEIITASVYITRPWLVFEGPLTVEQIYHHASEIFNGSTGGSVVS